MLASPRGYEHGDDARHSVGPSSRLALKAQCATSAMRGKGSVSPEGKMRSRGAWGRALRLLVRGLAISLMVAMPLVLSTGCWRPHFHVDKNPAEPDRLPVLTNDRAAEQARIQVENFRVYDDTQYPQDERALLRRTFSLEVPNQLYEVIGKSGRFSEVVRVERGDATTADFVVSGTCEHFDRLGGGGKRWIPYYGAGGTFVRAWVRETIDVRVVESRSGATILRKSFADEEQLAGRGRDDLRVTFWRPEFIARVAAAVGDAIQRPKGRSETRQ
jgi:hypothetical protein